MAKFFLLGACRGRQNLIFPQKTPKKFSAPVTYLKIKLFHLLCTKSLQKSCQALVGKTPCARQPEKEVEIRGKSLLCRVGIHPSFGKNFIFRLAAGAKVFLWFQSSLW